MRYTMFKNMQNNTLQLYIFTFIGIYNLYRYICSRSTKPCTEKDNVKLRLQVYLKKGNLQLKQKKVKI